MVFGVSEVLNSACRKCQETARANPLRVVDCSASCSPAAGQCPVCSETKIPWWILAAGIYYAFKMGKS